MEGYGDGLAGRLLIARERFGRVCAGNLTPRAYEALGEGGRRQGPEVVGLEGLQISGGHTGGAHHLLEAQTPALAEFAEIRAERRHGYLSSLMHLRVSGTELYGDQLREPRLLHCDAVEDVGGLHRPAVVGDDEELGLAGELTEDAKEPVDVGVVERRVDLVEHAERARSVIEDREEQREPGQRALATREQRDRLQPLASRLGHELDTRIQGIAAFLGLDQA